MHYAAINSLIRLSLLYGQYKMPRILVVDDDAAMRDIIKENLSAIYEVIGTGVSEEVIALTLEHRPDAILLDLSMPGISGFELCRALSSLTFTQQVPVFIVSGEDERNTAFCREPRRRRIFYEAD